VLDAKRRKASVVHLVQCTKHQQRLQGNTAYSPVAVDQSWQLSYVMYSGQLRMTYDQSVQQLIDSVDVVAASFAALAWPALSFPRRECRRRQRAGIVSLFHMRPPTPHSWWSTICAPYRYTVPGTCKVVRPAEMARGNHGSGFRLLSTRRLIIDCPTVASRPLTEPPYQVAS